MREAGVQHRASRDLAQVRRTQLPDLRVGTYYGVNAGLAMQPEVHNRQQCRSIAADSTPARSTQWQRQQLQQNESLVAD